MIGAGPEGVLNDCVASAKYFPSSQYDRRGGQSKSAADEPNRSDVRRAIVMPSVFFEA